MNIAEKIKEARTALGITQEKAAEELLVSRQTVSSWENGRSLPDIVSVIKMSELYHLSLDELLKGDKEMIKKIEKDSKLAKIQKSFFKVAFASVIAYAIIMLLHLFFDGNSVIDFIYGATPGTLLGLNFLFTMISFNKLESNE